MTNITSKFADSQFADLDEWLAYCLMKSALTIHVRHG